MPNPSFNLLIVFVLVLITVGCGTKAEHNSDADVQAQKPVQDSVYEISIISAGQGWGYQVKRNGSVIINQLTIPAISGRHAFVSEAEARKTASLVIHKLNKGLMPPSVTTAELDSLGITY